MSERSSDPGEFYVGYLDAPRALARAMWGVAAGLLAGFVLLAALLAGAQAFPGGGTWDTTGAGVFEGELFIDPYPRLLTRDERGAPMDAVLVEPGKFGATARASAFAGRRVRVRGGLVRWGGRAVIELLGTPDDMVSLGATDAAPAAAPGEAVTLVGEIVDPKCYLGVMNPGFGRPHVSCAELCILGGVPPVLVVRAPHAANGRAEGECHLLTSADGEAANAMVRGWIGRPVRVEGVLRSARHDSGWGSIAVSRIAPAR